MESIDILIRKEYHHGTYYYQAMMNPDTRGKMCDRIDDALDSLASVLTERIVYERNRLRHIEDLRQRLVQEQSYLSAMVLEKFQLLPTQYVNLEYQYDTDNPDGHITTSPQ